MPSFGIESHFFPFSALTNPTLRPPLKAACSSVLSHPSALPPGAFHLLLYLPCSLSSRGGNSPAAFCCCRGSPDGTTQYYMALYGTAWHGMPLHTSPACCTFLPILFPSLHPHSDAFAPASFPPSSARYSSPSAGHHAGRAPRFARRGNKEGPHCHPLTTHGRWHLTATSSPTLLG